MRKSHLLPAVIAVLSFAGCNQREAAQTQDQANIVVAANAVANDANTSAQQTAAAAKPVPFRGCPIKSEVGNCLTVKSDNGVTYELYSSGPLPDPGQRLIVQGTGMSGGVSSCMVGTPLNNVQWEYTKQKCNDKE
jgi:hypothetical protein